MPISPIMSRNNPFTLIEITVVMAIILLATGLTVAAFRGESPARKLQSTALEFETFCAGVRYQAMEHGEERIVSLDLQNRQLVMRKPEKEGEEEEDPAEIRTRWTFPENFSLNMENDPGSELVELFRFFPDGGASGMRELVFRYKSLERKYKISPLTGRLFAEEMEE